MEIIEAFRAFLKALWTKGDYESDNSIVAHFKVFVENADYNTVKVLVSAFINPKVEHATIETPVRVNNIITFDEGDCPYYATFSSYKAERKINAIKTLRHHTKLGLKEAKDFIEAKGDKMIVLQNRGELEEFISSMKYAGVQFHRSSIDHTMVCAKLIN